MLRQRALSRSMLPLLSAEESRRGGQWEAGNAADVVADCASSSLATLSSLCPVDLITREAGW